MAIVSLIGQDTTALQGRQAVPGKGSDLKSLIEDRSARSRAMQSITPEGCASLEHAQQVPGPVRAAAQRACLTCVSAP